MSIQRLTLWAVCAIVLIAPSVYADTIVYNFSAPQFVPFSTTPFINIAPNIGPSTFTATFTANTSTYGIQNSTLIPQFSGPVLRSDCFCAQTLTIQFNTPVNAISFDFATVTAGAVLTLTTPVGTVSAVSTLLGPGNGGSISFSSPTAFSSVQLGTGVFSIDNLTLQTVPEPSSLIMLGVAILAVAHKVRHVRRRNTERSG